MEICSVTSKGQVTIPKSVRQQLGICQGSKVSFSLQKGTVELHVVSNPQPLQQSGFGMLKSKLASVAVDLDPASLVNHDRT